MRYVSSLNSATEFQLCHLMKTHPVFQMRQRAHAICLAPKATRSINSPTSSTYAATRSCTGSIAGTKTPRRTGEQSTSGTTPPHPCRRANPGAQQSAPTSPNNSKPSSAHSHLKGDGGCALALAGAGFLPVLFALILAGVEPDRASVAGDQHWWLLLWAYESWMRSS